MAQFSRTLSVLEDYSVSRFKFMTDTTAKHISRMYILTFIYTESNEKDKKILDITVCVSGTRFKTSRSGLSCVKGTI